MRPMCVKNNPIHEDSRPSNRSLHVDAYIGICMYVSKRLIYAYIHTYVQNSIHIDKSEYTYIQIHTRIAKVSHTLSLSLCLALSQMHTHTQVRMLSFYSFIFLLNLFPPIQPSGRTHRLVLHCLPSSRCFYCNTLQHTATYCNTLQHTVTQ